MTDEDQEPYFSLEAGIDGGRFTRPVRDAVASLRQGTLVSLPPLIYAANGQHPLFAATVAWAATERALSGAVNIRAESRRPPWGLIVTQTCDLVEEGRPKRPWVLLAPVYKLDCDRGTRRRIEQGRGFAYLTPIPTLSTEDDFWVADLRLLVPVEKGWLVDATTRPAYSGEEQRDRLSAQLSRQFSRQAYATPLVEHILRPLAELLGDISERWDGKDPIVEVGLASGRSRMDPSTVQVVFMLDGDLQTELHDLIVDWAEPIIKAPPEGISVLLPRIVSIDELSAREYRALDIIDAASFSPAETEDLQGQAGSGSSSTDEAL